MKSRKPIDDSELHAVVDGECDADVLLDVFTRMQKDTEYASAGCEISRTKELVKLAYADIEPLPTIERTQTDKGQCAKTLPMWMSFSLGMVASAALMALALWVLNPAGEQQAQPETDTAQRFVLLDPDGSGQELANPMREETRIVFQITNPDQANAEEVLNELEAVLETYRREGRALRVELVAHGEGLAIFRERLSKHGQRIAQLANRFNNLTFVACQNTIERISGEQGFAVKLLPHVEVINSGVNHVAERQAQGWAYIHL